VPEHYSNLAKAILAGPAPSVDEAMRWFEQAAELNPEARRSLATQLVLEGEKYRINEGRGGGRFDLVVFWFGLASRIDPTYDKPLVELGSSYYRTALTLAAAGQAAEAQARLDEAARIFRAALTLDSENSSSWHQLGEAEEAAGRLPEAVAAFEQAVRVAPRRSGLRVSLGRVYAHGGRCGEARRELDEALRLPDENGSHGRAQVELARSGDCRG
jgi:tetratricopeptide (TPR) repeat protein